MTATERTARTLAAELSKEGETDWKRYRTMAREVDARLDDDFRKIFDRADTDR